MNWIIELTKKLKPYSEKNFLLAVSGGLDSMALLYLFVHFREHFGFQFSVSYFHHGNSKDSDQTEFRKRAFGFVKEECEKLNVVFHSNYFEPESEFLKSFAKELSSEESMRKARYGYFSMLMSENSFDHLVLAHHQEDLLETRLLRLIRGTGPEGLEAMKFEEGIKLRPLLEVSKDQLGDFLENKKGTFLDDPSNSSDQYLRNWLRNDWLKSLEKKVPGSSQSLHRSLDLLVRSLDQSEDLDSFVQEDALKIAELLPLNKDERRQIVAAYMKSQGLKNYGLSHVNEVLKHLDREKKHHTFKLLGHCWEVDAGRMRVQLTP